VVPVRASSSACFAPDFAEQLIAQWNTGPRVFSGALRSSIFTPAEFMTALRGAADEYRANPSARVPPGRLYVNSEPAGADRLAALLPAGGGETAEQYVARIGDVLHGDEVGIVLDNCEQHVPAMRDGLVPVLHRLFSKVGYPARRNHLCIYAGNYRSTPFGIHRDDCHVLMLSGIGRKRMAFWPRPYFDEKTQMGPGGKLRVRLQDHLARATVLEIGPSDVLYWPADDWHVAVSDDNVFQAALSVGIYHAGSSAEIMASLDFLADVTADRGLDIRALPAAREGTLAADDLRRSDMAPFFERWARLLAMFDREQEPEFRALDRALRLISSAGYGRERAGRPAAPAQMSCTRWACAVPESLIVSAVRGGLLVGANGGAWFYDRATTEIEGVVRLLRDGRPHTFEELTEGLPPSAAGQVTAALRDFAGAGALTEATRE
jgi:hypothetical protein